MGDPRRERNEGVCEGPFGRRILDAPARGIGGLGRLFRRGGQLDLERDPAFDVARLEGACLLIEDRLGVDDCEAALAGESDD